MTPDSETLAAADSGAPLSLDEVAMRIGEQRLPPVDTWRPGREGRIDIRIAGDGTWYHAGTPIRRNRLTRLFSTILRREADGGYALVTPAEKLAIEVEDVPFIAVEAAMEGVGEARRIALRIGSGDLVIAGPDHPLTLRRAPSGGDALYVRVRGRLDARLARRAHYDLLEAAVNEANDPPGLWSGGMFFSFA